MVAFGIGRLPQTWANLPLDTESQTTGVEQIITALIDQDVLDDLPSMSPRDSESVPEFSSDWTPPGKHAVPARHVRSPRRGRRNSPMSLSLIHSAFRPEKQLPVPTNARSATSGEPAAVFSVLRN